MVKSFGSIAHRSEQLVSQLRDICAKSSCGKVNLIAHSMGGLDGRYAISHLGAEVYVASLTTVATPHRGSALADRLWRTRFFNKIPAIQDLTTSHMINSFNPSTPDSPNVHYFSVAGSTDIPLTNWMKYPATVLFKEEGPNDGLVSVESAKWGDIINTVPLNHCEQVNAMCLNPQSAAFFYLELARNLFRHGL
ncbi:alpha/beta hydrolase [Pelomyxa schiedti]|nr:alpha/beta hydrolase [Pelomyxa schiedti]